MSLSTDLTKMLKIKHPVMLAGMGGAAGPLLAAAVSNAGGIGTIGGAGLSPNALRMNIDEIKENLDDPNLPFGVDLLLPQVGGGARKTNKDYTGGKLDELTDIMIEKGLVNEVNALIKYKKFNALNTIGYKEIFEYLENKINLEEAIDKIKTNSRRYAKRQLTWFKSNKKVNWYSYDYDLKVILNMIKSFQSIQQST